MDNTELVNLLLKQLKESNDMVKSVSDNTNKIVEAYITKDETKDNLHRKTILQITITAIISMAIVVCFFIGSYFFSDFEPSGIYGDGNSTISGENNTIERGDK